MTRNPRTVADLMSEEVVTLERNETLSIADNVMRLGRIRHMPVIDEGGALCGVVSQRDLFRGALARALGYGTVAQTKIMKTIPVMEVMTTEPITTTPDAALGQAAQLMLDKKIGCLPVMESEKIVGILTEADFVALAARGKDS